MRRSSSGPAAPAADPAHRPADTQHALVEVDVLPLQPEQLPWSEPAGQPENEGRLERVALRRLQQHACLLNRQRPPLGAELADSAGAEGGQEVLAHRPRTHLQRAGGQLAASVPQPLFGERGDSDMPATRGEPVLGVALHLANLQQHLGAGAAGDLLALPAPGGVGVDKRPPATILGVFEDRPLPRPTSRHGPPQVSCLACTACAWALAGHICEQPQLTVRSCSKKAVSASVETRRHAPMWTD